PKIGRHAKGIVENLGNATHLKSLSVLTKEVVSERAPSSFLNTRTDRCDWPPATDPYRAPRSDPASRRWRAMYSRARSASRSSLPATAESTSQVHRTTGGRCR